MYLVFNIKVHGLNQLNYESFMNSSRCIIKLMPEQKTRELGNLRYNIVVPEGFG